MIPKISERTLRKWRKEALDEASTLRKLPLERTDYSNGFVANIVERDLKMTQELLDQHLIKSRK